VLRAVGEKPGVSASPAGPSANGPGARFGVWAAKFGLGVAQVAGLFALDRIGRWLTTGLFNRHLAFFFVPIAVGLLAFGDLFRESGPGILVSIIVGTAVGIAVTGGVTEWLLRIGSRSGDSR